MKRYINLLYAILLLIFSTSFISIHAQNCTAKAPSQVAIGQAFNYTISVSDKSAKLENASFTGLKVLGGPSQSTSSSISIVNGKVDKSETITFTYVLSAEKEGTYTIPPVSVKIGNKKLKSNSVTIKAVKGGQQSGGQGNAQQRGGSQSAGSFNQNDVFIKAFCTNSNPYQGEQITVTYKLYLGKSVNGGYQINDFELPKQSDLWAYELEGSNNNSRPPVENIDGKQYTVIEIKKTALFPQKSGKITITPMELDLIVRNITSSGDPFYDNFFGGGRAHDYNLKIKSNSISLNVKPLPENGKPENFSGVVGNFNIKALLSRKDLSTNDATNLTITVSGAGNLQYIDQLDQTFPPDFDVSDPTITDNINNKSNSVSGSRIFEYVIIPRSPGDFKLKPASFSYFDTKSKSYKTISTEEFSISVKKGEGDATTTTISSNQKEIKVLGKDIRFIKTKFTTPKLAHSHFFDSPLYYLLLFAPIILFFLFIIIWRKHIEYQSNTALVKNKRAHKVAKKSLKNAHILLREGKKDDFYIEISRALWGYLSDKYHIPLAQLSIETVEKTLTEKQIKAERISDFIDTLNQCEFARFAPGDSSQMMNEMYERALRFILTNEGNK